jgi:phosphoribosylformylglycinamidine synthase
MILFFLTPRQNIIAVQATNNPDPVAISGLNWLFGGSILLDTRTIEGWYTGPRKEMITPWSTNAVEITQNMGIGGIVRMEELTPAEGPGAHFDHMLQALYHRPGQDIFTIAHEPDPIMDITDIRAYSEKEGLALSEEETAYLESVSEALGRPLTDSEVFGFSQVNSEHCRHKIFNGTFIIDGKKMESSLFQLIKKTSRENPNKIISAYRDNCSFVQGPVAEQFAPVTQDRPDWFAVTDMETVLSLKAETHNFPTTVEPFNGASTGTGGEIRDRMAGGTGSIPVAGTAVYMTSYPRTEESRPWEQATEPRPWLYQTPEEILIKASNGASDFGNKFGQPLIAGSVFTFEHFENGKKYGFDKVVMLAGGIGFGKKKDSRKSIPLPGDRIILLGGDNYRIGMGGGAVSSVATGEYENAIELNAVQRANPEMQKRVFNAIRALAEMDDNPVISIHDHGAGGHLNCLSELVENVGGIIDTALLPVGDPTLSQKEIIGNESQERMGLVLHEKDIPLLQRIAQRERAPMYNIGKVTGDRQFTFLNSRTGEKPIDWQLTYMFGNPPGTVLEDQTQKAGFNGIRYDGKHIQQYTENVLQLESVACKDWLTNKVDRSVTGRIAKQQGAGKLHLPLNNVGVVTLDYQGKAGIATSIGHAPAVGLVHAGHGSVLSIAEALTNIIWVPLPDGIRSVSLSANWMWPAKNPGENARIYEAVKAASDFACQTGINIPTGKDSMSMTQKYRDDVVYSPGTVIISASAEVSDVNKVVEPVLVNDPSLNLLYIDLSFAPRCLGGSAFAQSLNRLGTETPTVSDPARFVKAFNSIQELVQQELITAGHDISSGGLLTTLLEMCFSDNETGMKLDLTGFGEKDTVKLLFAENPGVVVQCRKNREVEEILKANDIAYIPLGTVGTRRIIEIQNFGETVEFDIDSLRDLWFKTSYLLDRKQCGTEKALERFTHYKHNELNFRFGEFTGRFEDYGIDPMRRQHSGIKAAIIREKGVNGDREMAWMLYLAGFDVKDVHMTDLISGRETLEEINLIVFVGGFSNSDVLGSAKGWAGAFRYNEKARIALENFYAREDTLSLGVCNGCQLMIELGLINTGNAPGPVMERNESHKFESAFLNVDILPNPSVMLRNMEGMRLGIWVAHGEGRFRLPGSETGYLIPVKYSRNFYPANPNGSDYDTAALCSPDGRHLVMMPHLERAFRPYHWAYYPAERKGDEITPWMQAFVNAREWIWEKL